MKTDYNIIDNSFDDNDDEEYIIMKKNKNLKLKKEKQNINTLNKYFNEDIKIIEIGVDESGRGPLFGRVYTAAVVLPKDNSFDFTKVKDSKKFHSIKKIEEVAEYVKNNAIAWTVTYEDEKKIDEINILQATQLSMHNSIMNILKEHNDLSVKHSINLLIDGNYFNPITTFNKETNKIEIIPYLTIEGGDNKYASIAAASILAKVERDKYIDELCKENPELIENYGINSNKGYGSKRHLDGIKKYGITTWHRKSFSPCKNYI